MKKNNLIVMGVIGLLLLLVSLPLEWMTITSVRMQTNSPMFNEMGNMMDSMMRNMAGSVSIPVTGLDGSITFGFTMPIWLLVIVGGVGIALGLAKSMQAVSLPKVAIFIPLIFSAVFVIIALCSAMFSSEATVGIGGFAALSGLVLGFIVTAASDNSVSQV